MKLTLEYDGAGFAGWQVQPGQRTVQEVVERALSKLCGAEVRVTAAGRTDAGVHARGQVISFTAPRALPFRAWTAGLNALLPEDVACIDAEEAPTGFDARRWARGKLYAYSILQTPVRRPLEHGRAWEIRRPLEIEPMRAAARALTGRHDFSAFRAADCPAKTTIREVRRLDVLEHAPAAGVRIEIEATAFLKHMVRNIVGTVVECGHGKRDPASLSDLLAARDRTRAGPTAPPHGLVLERVFYLPGNADPREAPADE